MIDASDTYERLFKMQEGDEFEACVPFRFDPAEPMVWRCQERVLVDAETGIPIIRVVLHVYFRGVMLRSLVAKLCDKTHAVLWEGV